MRKFKYIDEVQEWLGPVDYQGFWHVVAPYDLVLQPREHCDQQIRDGLVDQETVLNVLKSMVEMELTKRHGLRWKPATPWLKLVESH